MKRIVQHAVLKVVKPQVVEYTCDECGDVCGTRANPKETWYECAEAGHEVHYCKRNPRWNGISCGPHGQAQREQVMAALTG